MAKMILLSILLSCSQSTIDIGTAAPLFVPSSNPSYKADHATVAINNSNDVLIAYHSNAGPNGVKQVEIAHYKLNTTPGALVHTESLIVGDASFDPLGNGGTIKCERPDMIAVGDMFFVVWTRINDEVKEQAVLECAWVKYDATNGLQVFNDTAAAGLGYALDSHSSSSSFHVKECAGVPDAFVVADTGNELRAGVVYPHQTKMSYPPNLDYARRFDIRIAFSAFNKTTDTLMSSVMSNVVSDVHFDGEDGDAAGLILPDAVRGNATDEFWLTYESQIESSTVKQGKVRLAYVKKNIVGNAWAPQATYVFGANTAKVLRRPMLSNHVDASLGVSLAFSSQPNYTSQATADVHYSNWTFNNSSLAQQTMTHQFNNSSADEKRPLPFHVSGYRRCYFNRDDKIIYYNQYDDQETIISGAQAIDASRPAVDIYRAPAKDYIATTWEQGNPLRVWIYVTD